MADTQNITEYGVDPQVRAVESGRNPGSIESLNAMSQNADRLFGEKMYQEAANDYKYIAETYMNQGKADLAATYFKKVADALAKLKPDIRMRSSVMPIESPRS